VFLKKLANATFQDINTITKAQRFFFVSYNIGNKPSGFEFLLTLLLNALKKNVASLVLINLTGSFLKIAEVYFWVSHIQ
jgi:hypothetical protein